MLDVPVPEIGLQRSGVVAVIGQLVSAGMPEHVWMGLKAKLRPGAGAFDHARESRRAKGCVALGGEHERRFRLLLTQ